MGEWTKIIGGIPVKFPYENPYDIQINYMEKVIESLEQKKHAILESPTGNYFGFEWFVNLFEEKKSKIQF